MSTDVDYNFFSERVEAELGIAAYDEGAASRYALLSQWVLKDLATGRISREAFCLYAIMNFYGNINDGLIPDWAELADQLDCSDEETAAALDELYKRGWVSGDCEQISVHAGPVD
ncbi:hypothetical protein O7630_06650 [Micromonospora sp. WMMD718]|uniref:hypothetical protein n=1 Tax=unclassified Micromonospora TaxID=2617518 RepID=UPI00128B9366|nr:MULTISPECIES: hypothetical protein [unclassified Micromonospora]MDG4750610.1 hypothetical protein [Micromonospora sp. WMMD718]